MSSTSSWRVCALGDLAPDSAERFEVEGRGIAVVRIGDDVYAIGDRCSHADYSLAEGELDAAARTLECWKHGSAFSLVTGEPETLPATRPVPVYAVEIRGGDVFVVARTGDDSVAGENRSS